MAPSIKNVSVSEFKRFLTRHGLKLIRISGGHVKYVLGKI